MSTFWRMLHFMKPYRLQMSAAILLGFLTVGANVGLMGTSGYLIAAAALHPENVLLIWLPIVGVRFFGLSRGVFRYLERLFSHDAAFRVLAGIRKWLYGRLEPRGAELLEKNRSGDMLGSVVSDVEQLQHFFLRLVAPPVIALLTIGLCFSILAAYHYSLGLLVALMLILAGAGIPYAAHRFGRVRGESLAEARAELYLQASELVTGLPELVAAGREGEQLLRLESTQRRIDGLNTGMNRIASLSGAAMSAMAKLAMWLVLLTAIPLIGQGKLEGLALPTLILVTLAGFESVMALPAAFQQAGQTLAAGKRLFALADAPLTQPSYGQAAGCSVQGLIELNQPPLEIRFQQVQMHYPDGTSALRQLSFELKQDQHVAIVGESGAGKSSILQLLLKLRPYQTGSILLNRMELRELPEEAVRSLFGVVSQQVQLFNATVLENLRLGKPGASAEECMHAAKLALIHDAIEAMPQGYDTVIGEGGARLSGGERQRVALARALLRDAPITLFDEPTSSLDPLTRQAFVQSMRTVLKNRTVLWITHRLEGLETMDHIIVVRQGSVCEQGTHPALIEARGAYWKLREAQRRRWI
ncbi:thiol reductant ABC exporter subunit CydC [Paenibacillus montanisoli]|uniref:Thiol reductant ABC exporter subunit CydC n=1 Tax=Paenibacillus montanisoli TaxID=2081970 RepID=A0A328TWY7_9BACL|nr:thiol reductant ABC exporter subunit CydC [Paenibacillus montanisoli]RAP74202.1 thiol reductant ABC exporter subunit CydC [Paenibacillus montanisoli]